MALVAKLTLDGQEFELNLKKAERQTHATAGKMSKFFKKVGQDAALAAGAFSLGFGVSAVKSAGDFQYAMAKLSTVAGKDTQKLREEILKMDPALGSAKDAAEAAYQAISAGVAPSKAVEFLKKAAIASKGGFTDLTTAVDAGTTVLNSFGISADKADEIFDKFLATQNLGKTTFGELAQSIGDVASTAASFGMDIDTLLGLIASLTKSGIQTPRAITNIRAAISNLQKPASDAKTELMNLGFAMEQMVMNKKGKLEAKQVFDEESFRKFLGKEGLVGLLELIKEKSPDTGLAISKIFGSVEAQSAANALVGTLQDTKSNIEGVGTAAGSSSEAADKMANTFSDRLAAVTNAFDKLKIEIGNEFLPQLEELTKFLLDNTEALKTFFNIVASPIRATARVGASIGEGVGSVAAVGVAAKEGGFSKMLEVGQKWQEERLKAVEQRGMVGRFFTGFGPLGEVAGKGLGLTGFHKGGIVPGTGNKDSVPAMLTPGEAVLTKDQVGALPGLLGVDSSGGGFGEDFGARVRAFWMQNTAIGVKDGMETGGKKGMGTAKGKEAAGLSSIVHAGMFKSSAAALVDGFVSGDVSRGIKGFADTLKQNVMSQLISGLTSALSSSLFGGGGLFGFAGGTDSAPGGLAVVGERGPEIVNLPQGSKVHTAEESRSMLGPSFNFAGAVFQFGGGDREITYAEAEMMARAIVKVSRAGGAPEFERAGIV